MARQCKICGKKRMIVWRLKKLRGKYNPTTKRIQRPNLQWVKIPIDIKRKDFKRFSGTRILACTKCIKTMYKENRK